MNKAAPATGAEDISALIVTLFIIVIAGLVGGTSAFLANDRDIQVEDSQATVGRYLMLGVVASACVPLFLSLTRSNILVSMLAIRSNDRLSSFLIFGGLCVIAAFLGRSFITTISERVLQQVKEAREEAKEAAKKADIAQETALEVADEQSAEAVPRAELARRNEAARAESAAPVDDTERTVLKALTKLSFRTATGVATDAGISRNSVGEVLDSLHEKGLAEVTQSPTTKGVRWRITPAGIAALTTDV